MGDNRKATKVKPNVKRLPSALRAKVRSEVIIANLAQCVQELVLNAIDAEATKIYVGVNFDHFNVRVEDDGVGLSKVDLALVGTRYATSKCSSIEDLKSLKFYGYRGESLSSIIEVSNTVSLLSRCATGPPYRHRFSNGKPYKEGIEELPESKKKSRGLTVIVHGLLEKKPVRRKRLDKSLQLEEVKSTLEQIALINPNISIEFRNEENMSPVLNYTSSASYSEAFDKLFGAKNKIQFDLVQETFLYGPFLFKSCIGRQMARTKNYQFVFINRRYVAGRGKLHKYLNDKLMKVLDNQQKVNPKFKSDKKYPVFIVNILCPLDQYDIIFDKEHQKSSVEFVEWETCSDGVDGLILEFQHKFLSLQDKAKQAGAVERERKFGKLGIGGRTRGRSADSDDPVGLNVTTHDVKRAIHSQFAVRETLIPPLSSNSDESSAKRARSARSVMSVEDDSLASFRSRESRSPAGSMRERFEARLGKGPSLNKSNRDRNTSKKTTTYEVRRSIRKASLKAGVKRKASIVVPKKPLLNASVLRQFPEWINQQEQPKIRSRSSIESSPAPKVPRYSDIISAPKPLPDKKKTSFSESYNLNYKPKPKPKLGPNRQNEVRKEQNLSKDSILDLGKEQISYDWKMDRYLKTCSEELENGEKKGSSDSSGSREVLPIVEIVSTSNSVDASASDKSNPKQVNKTAESEHDVKLESLVEVQSSAETYRLIIDASVELSSEFLEKWRIPSRPDEVTNFLRDKLDRTQFGKILVKVNDAPQPSKVARLQSQSQSPPEFNNPKKIAEESFTIFSQQCQSQRAPLAQSQPFPIRLVSRSPSYPPPPAKKTYPPPSATVTSLPPATASQTSDIFGLKYIANNSFFSSKPLVESNNPLPISGSDPPITSFVDLFASTSSTELNQSFFNTNTNVMDESNDTEEDWADWEVDIIKDPKGQDWLQTTEEGSVGRSIFMNLATGDLSYDMVNVVTRNKISIKEASKLHTNSGNWLRRYFPKGFAKLWNRDTTAATATSKLRLNGDITAETSHLGDRIKEVICRSTNQDQDELNHSKWGEFSTLNQEPLVSNHCSTSEYWRQAQGIQEIPVANLNAPEMKFWNKSTSQSFRFSKQDLTNVKVITQFDRKFIVAKMTVDSVDRAGSRVDKKEILVLFDQHAVHERIRLEQFITESYITDDITGQKRITRTVIMPPIVLPFSETEVRIVERYKDLFSDIGLEIQIPQGNMTTVKILSAPKCFSEKVQSENIGNREAVMRNLLTTLVQEQVKKIIDTKGGFGNSMPKTIFNLLCSQACHGAIKFGNELDLGVCEVMLAQLKNCKTPFQCAHGRPSLVPLIDLASVMSSLSPRTKLNTLLDNAVTARTEGHASWNCNNNSISATDDQESIYFDQTSSEYFSF